MFPVDKTRPIEFINQTGQQLVVYESGRRYPEVRHNVAAASRYRSVWPDPGLDGLDERKKFRVEAVNATGTVIFCHDYTMKDFTQANWVVVNYGAE